MSAGLREMLEGAAGLFALEEDVAWFLKGLAGPLVRGLLHDWSWQWHEGQREPEGEWRVWMVMAGRGFGKTMAGAQWVTARARAHPGARIALVGGSFDEVAKVMVEGPSGLIALARADEPVEWVPTTGILRFHSGAEAFVYAAAGRNCAGPSIIMPGRTKWRNGRRRAAPGSRRRRRAGTI